MIELYLCTSVRFPEPHCTITLFEVVHLIRGKGITSKLPVDTFIYTPKYVIRSSRDIQLENTGIARGTLDKFNFGSDTREEFE